MLDRSISLFVEVGSQIFDSFIQFSGVLGHSIVHLVLDVEGSDDVVVLGLGNTGSSVFLNIGGYTFLR